MNAVPPTAKAARLAAELEEAIVSLRLAEYAHEQFGGPGTEVALMDARARVARAKRRIEEEK